MRRVTAVKNLPVHLQSGTFNLFPFEALSLFVKVENLVSQKQVLGPHATFQTPFLSYEMF